MKLSITSTVFGLILLATLSCQKSGENPGMGKDLVLTESEQQIAEANNVFTLKMLKEVTSKEGTEKNILLSPLSASIVLSMTSNGSNGTTLEAMRKSLELQGFSEEQINKFYLKLITELPKLDPQTSLKIANSIWYRNTFNVLPAFLETNTSYYEASVEALDFSLASSKDKINDWVKKATSNKITQIIDEIPGDAVMYLINAVYFKGNWKFKFDKGKTKKAPFYLNDNRSVQADFMTTEANFKVSGTTDARIVELPYGNDKYSMLFVMPLAGKSLNDVTDNLDAIHWRSAMNNLFESKATIVIPKFKFNYAIALNETLNNMGMGEIFSGNADFTRINSNGNLSVSKVKQKTYLDVNEEGTEAAAVTSVEIVLTSAPAQPQPLVIDRPFLLVIREMKTGLILFAGKVENPLLTGE